MQNEYKEELLEQLNRMSEIPVKEIDPDDVAELSEIRIDKKLSLDERILSLIDQAGNPYVYKDGGIVVKIHFAENGRTLQSCMEDYLAAEILMNH